LRRQAKGFVQYAGLLRSLRFDLSLAGKKLLSALTGKRAVKSRYVDMFNFYGCPFFHIDPLKLSLTHSLPCRSTVSR
jgi:hypothetical protein